MKYLMLIISVLSTIASFILLVFLFKQNRHLAKSNEVLILQVKHMISDARVSKALDYLKQFDSVEFKKGILDVLSYEFHRTREEREKNGKPVLDYFESREIAELVDQQENSFYHAVMGMINFFNQIGDLYTRNIIDRQLIINKLANTSLVWYKRLKPFIDDMKNSKYTKMKIPSKAPKIDWEVMNEHIQKSIITSSDEVDLNEW